MHFYFRGKQYFWALNLIYLMINSYVHIPSGFTCWTISIGILSLLGITILRLCKNSLIMICWLGFFFFLQIRDGFIRQSTLIGKYCGRLQKFTVNSTSNTINLILVSTSNTNIRYRGFKATYKSNVKGHTGIIHFIHKK